MLITERLSPHVSQLDVTFTAAISEYMAMLWMEFCASDDLHVCKNQQCRGLQETPPDTRRLLESTQRSEGFTHTMYCSQCGNFLDPRSADLAALEERRCLLETLTAPFRALINERCLQEAPVLNSSSIFLLAIIQAVQQSLGVDEQG